MRFFTPIWPLLKGWLLSLLVFGLVAVVMEGQFALVFSPTWEESVRMAARDWAPWAIIAPLLFRLVFRLPLERGRWKLGLPLYVLAGLGSVAFCNWWSDSVVPRPQTHSWSQSHGEVRTGNGETHEWHTHDGTGGTEGREWRAREAGGVGNWRWRPPERGTLSRYFFLFGFRFPIYLAIISVAHAFFFYRRAKDRERRTLELQAGLAQARLEALKMQLQPHFLFNALNAIAALMHKDIEAADEMLAALSDFLRLVLETSGEQELPLRRELELVERYLAIEHARFGDRLKFVVDVPRETEPALVPAFLLQPLVENAVRHGLEPRPGAGSLSIRARREDGTLRLTVADDGVGLPEKLPAREGIGLGNTRARLLELYRGAARLELHNGAGVTVDITLPFHEVPA